MLENQCAGLCEEGCCETFGKRKNTQATGECNFTLSESLTTFLGQGSSNPAHGKPFGNYTDLKRQVS